MTAGAPMPRGIRNNNPGNIRVSGDNWLGAIGDDGEFVIFARPEYGVRAMARILASYQRRGIDTVREIIQTWAPAVENNTAAYVAHVAQRVGVHPDLQLTPNVHWPALIDAMILHENGQQPYSAALIREGIALA